jgi:hypothetical protein
MCREERERGNVACYLLEGRAREAASLLNVGVASDNLVTPIRTMLVSANEAAY